MKTQVSIRLISIAAVMLVITGTANAGPAPRGPGADSIEALACEQGGGQFDSGWHSGKIEYRCAYPGGKVIRGTVGATKGGTRQPGAMPSPPAVLQK